MVVVADHLAGTGRGTKVRRLGRVPVIIGTPSQRFRHLDINQFQKISTPSPLSIINHHQPSEDATNTMSALSISPGPGQASQDGTASLQILFL